MFKESKTLIDPIKAKIHQMLWEHGRHVRSYLEWNADVSTNHYLSNLLGLFYLGSALREESWREFSINEFKREIFGQTYEDGMDHEGSTAYHKFVLEIFFYFVLSMDRHRAHDATNGGLGEAELRRFRKMFEALGRLTDEIGRIPLIGDNDSGRIHSLLNRTDSDSRFLLSAGQMLGAKTESRFSFQETPELAWLFGFEPSSRRAVIPAEAGIQTTASSKASADWIPAFAGMTANCDRGGSGLLVLSGEKDHLVFSAQPNGTRGLGNHSHNDKLSFTLSVGEDQFFIDPGSGLYTSDPAIRNKMRSTLIHNTVEIDGQEQNDFLADDLFALADQAKVTVEKYSLPNLIKAHHVGYCRLKLPVLHGRTVERKSPEEWLVRDEFQGQGSHQLKWNFTLGDQILVEPEGRSRVVLNGKRGQLIFDVKDSSNEWVVEQTVYSPAYGVLRPTRALRMVQKPNLPFQLEFHLTWKPLAS
jgi:hypothetical protein